MLSIKAEIIAALESTGISEDEITAWTLWVKYLATPKQVAEMYIDISIGLDFLSHK